jgi:hypothetical protein
MQRRILNIGRGKRVPPLRQKNRTNNLGWFQRIISGEKNTKNSD